MYVNDGSNRCAENGQTREFSRVFPGRFFERYTLSRTGEETPELESRPIAVAPSIRCGTA
jgi:hypothetical protein